MKPISGWTVLLLLAFALVSFFPGNDPHAVVFWLVASAVVFVLWLFKPLPKLDSDD
ncbi:MAG: hypothetical protein LBI35_07250 [Burkholderiales bacterium]|jgi:hypothetical protein|nr:hypothetical protein [Burkholderiales bacterium]